MAVTVKVKFWSLVLFPEVPEEIASITRPVVPTGVSAVVSIVRVTVTLLPMAAVMSVGEKLQVVPGGGNGHHIVMIAFGSHVPCSMTCMVTGGEVKPRFTVTAGGDGGLRS
jgi:hypothetical protein